MTRYLLDTNVLIRFLRGDRAERSRAALKLFSEANDGKCVLVLTEVAVAEAVWVLESVYRADRKLIADGLRKVILSAGIRCANSDVMLDALVRFGAAKLDFLDCYLAALAAASGDRVATFDKDFDRFDDVQRWEPDT